MRVQSLYFGLSFTLQKFCFDGNLYFRMIGNDDINIPFPRIAARFPLIFSKSWFNIFIIPVKTVHFIFTGDTHGGEIVCVVGGERVGLIVWRT